MRIILIILVALFHVSYARADDKIVQLPNIQVVSDKKTVDQTEFARLEKLEILYKGSLSKYDELRLEYDTLNRKFLDLNKSIKNMGIQIQENDSGLAKVTNSYSFFEERQQTQKYESNWLSYLLASVAIIITALGVGIALLAFWGYKNIKGAAVEDSIQKSKEASESFIENAIEEGKFSDLISKAVDRVIYRDILSRDDFPESENNNDNK